jgi:hypothetical protein
MQNNKNYLFYNFNVLSFDFNIFTEILGWVLIKTGEREPRTSKVDKKSNIHNIQKSPALEKN